MIQERTRLIVDKRRPETESPDESQLRLHVLYTGPNDTAPALHQASVLAGQLGARLTILAMLTVPYPLALEEPPVAVDFIERALWQLAEGVEADTTVQIYLCRDSRETFRQVLPPGSTVLIGDRRWPSWWPARERRLAKTLRGDGHVVFLIDPLYEPDTRA